MNTQIAVNNMTPQSSQVSKAKNSDDTDNIDNKQSDRKKPKDFDGLLEGILGQAESTVDANGKSMDGVAGENMPFNGNSLPSSIAVSKGAEVDKVESRLLLPEQATSLAADNAMAAFTHDNPVAGGLVKDSSNMSGADLLKQLPAQAQNAAMMASANQLKQAALAPSGVNALSDDMLADQALALQATKSSIGPDSKVAFLAVDAEIGRLAQQFAQGRFSDKATDKLSAVNSASSILAEGAETVLSLSNPNQSPLDAKSITQLSLPQTVGSPQWSNDLGERIRWLLSSNIQRAEIRLNPGNLGMIDISITLDKDNTHIQIVAQNPLTKDALEASVAKLREMLDESCSGQVEIDVSHESEDNTAKKDTAQSALTDEAIDDGSQVISSEQAISSNEGLIDFYA